MAYNVLNLDHPTRGKVRCQCGRNVFATPEPPTDPFFSGRFWCIECGAKWSTENIRQSVTFQTYEMGE